MSQSAYRPHYEHLKNKWTDKQKTIQEALLEKHKDAITWIGKAGHNVAVGSLSSLLFLSQPIVNALPNQALPVIQKDLTNKIEKNIFLIIDLSHVLPDSVRPLKPAEEDVVAQTLSRHFGFKVTADMAGKRLNRNYGYIGAEQHLTRYAGDSMATHFQADADSQKYYSSGMAPGKGAWGYFASSGNLSEKDILREKYYIAVPTFLSPGYAEHVNEYYNFFKYRRMLVVNPENGKAVVAVIGDSGPAVWTGKHLGGSPEVMSYLERVDGSQKGPVLYFFIEDQTDNIPLGPVETK